MKETYGLNIYGSKIPTEAEGGLCRPIGMIHSHPYDSLKVKLHSGEYLTCKLTTAFVDAWSSW